MKPTIILRILHRASGILLLSSAVWLTGCVKEALLDPDTPRTDGIIRINSAIDATTLTKVAVEGNAGLHDISFLRKDVEGATAPTSFTGITPISGSRDWSTNGRIAFATNVRYNTNNENAWFIAYWPTVAPISDVVTWNVDGKTDILLTPGYNAGTYAAPLNGTGGAQGDVMRFRHQLAQLEVICMADPMVTEKLVQDTWGKVTKIEIMNSNSQAKLNYATPGNLSYDTPANIALNRDYTNEFPASGMALTQAADASAKAVGMFAPDVATSSTAPIKLKVYTEKFTAGVTVNVQLKNGTTDSFFEKGKRHTVTLTFKAVDKSILVLSTVITDWGTGYTAEGQVKESAVGSYYYSDGSVSAALSGGTPVGVIFWVNPDDDTNFKICTMDAVNRAWTIIEDGTRVGDTAEYADFQVDDLAPVESVGRQNGAVNTEMLKKWIADPSANTTGKTLDDFPAFAYCDELYAGVSGWYLPAPNEMQYLYCAYNGAAPTLWIGGSVYLYNEIKMNEWNMKFTAANGTPFFRVDYWCATESAFGAWNVYFEDGTTGYNMNPTLENAVRCIKEIK